jgi:RNA methyltransferase, TrmH family
VCREAIAAGDVIELFHTPEHDGLAAELSGRHRVTRVDERVMARLSDQPTPPGVLAVVRTPDLTGTPPPDGSLLVLDGVSDPGNVGTLVRTATALGVGVVSVGGADPFGPKAVRASAGTCYRARLSRADALVDIADALRAGGRPLLGLAAEGERTLREVADSIEGTGFVLVVGAEPHGIGAGARSALDGLVRIPMHGAVESLNVSAAGAIALHTLSGG